MSVYLYNVISLSPSFLFSQPTLSCSIRFVYGSDRAVTVSLFPLSSSNDFIMRSPFHPFHMTLVIAGVFSMCTVNFPSFVNNSVYSHNLFIVKQSYFFMQILFINSLFFMKSEILYQSAVVNLFFFILKDLWYM